MPVSLNTLFSCRFQWYSICRVVPEPVLIDWSLHANMTNAGYTFYQSKVSS